MMDVPPIAGNIILVHNLLLRAKSNAYAVKETMIFFHEEKNVVRFSYFHSSSF